VNPRRALVLFVASIVSLSGIAGCSGDEETPESTVAIGVPDPPLPADVNAIPYVVGAIGALGNIQVRITIPDPRPVISDDVYLLNVEVTSGALEPIRLDPSMFRLYTVDGRSYLPEAVGDFAQFGAVELESGEVHSGVFAATITTGSEPALFLVNPSDLGERFLVGAFAVDPNFEPVSPEN
jgi:hypothetical protein